MYGKLINCLSYSPLISLPVLLIVPDMKGHLVCSVGELNVPRVHWHWGVANGNGYYMHSKVEMGHVDGRKWRREK